MSKRLTPLDSIRRGVEQGDWALVVRGYNQMSGARLKAPAGQKKISSPGDVPAEVKKEIVREALADYLAGGEVKPLSPRRKKARAAEESPGIEEEEEEEDTPPTPPPRTRGDADFTHVHAGRRAPAPPAAGEHPDGVPCRVEPFVPGSHRNAWRDTGRLAAREAETDRKLTAGLRPGRRRPKVKMVKVTCVKCGKGEEVGPGLAPRKLMGEATSYVCDRCIRRRAE